MHYGGNIYQPQGGNLITAPQFDSLRRSFNPQSKNLDKLFAQTSVLPQNNTSTFFDITSI